MIQTFEILFVFLEFFENVYFEKASRWEKKQEKSPSMQKVKWKAMMEPDGSLDFCAYAL